MFVGHGLLALAVVSAVAVHRGWAPRRALTLGLVAAGFATLPDVDVVYPLVATLAGAGSTGALTQDFWRLSTTIHRGVTHSLVVGVWTAGAVGLWAMRWTGRAEPGADHRESEPSRRASLADPSRWAILSEPSRWAILADPRATRGLAVVVLAALVGTVAAVAGLLAAATMAIMAVGAVAIAVVGTRAGVGARALGVAALVGLCTHPFGDLFTGQPPPLLFPLGALVPGDAAVFGSRVALHGDPTLHLVGAFLAELATVWLAVGVVALLVGRRPWQHVRPQALAGVGFAAAVLAIPAPSLSAATGFVAGALAVGVVGVPLERRFSVIHCWDALCTALVAVTLGVVSYGVAYALL